MTYGIIGALDQEIALVKEKMTEVEESNPPFATFIKKFYVTFQLENSIPLKDGRFAAGSRDFYGFGIYNPANASHCEIMIRTNSSANNDVVPLLLGLPVKTNIFIFIPPFVKST